MIKQFLKSYIIEGFIIIVLLVALVASAIYPTYIGDIWNMAAIIIGPAFGLYFVKWHGREAQTRQAQLKILHDMVSYGDNSRSPDTDAALRLIPVYYQGQKEVLCKLSDYIEKQKKKDCFLEMNIEKLKNKKARDEKVDKLWNEKRSEFHSALTQLILEMSKSLGSSLSVTEFQKSWESIVPLDTLSPSHTRQSEERRIMTGLISILEDDKAIEVKIKK